MDSLLEPCREPLKKAAAEALRSGSENPTSGRSVGFWGRAGASTTSGITPKLGLAGFGGLGVSAQFRGLGFRGYEGLS